MKQIKQRIPILLAAILVIAVLLQGCGGGSKSSSLHGTVADFDRNVVIDADVWVGDHETKSLVTGAFRLDNVPSGWQTVRARAIVDGRQWEGSTAAEVLENEPTMNANIVLAPAGDLTTITGYVFDDVGHRISGARVLVTTRILLPSGSSSGDGAYGSIVAVTDDRGFYRLLDVPMGRSAVISASKVAFENDEVQIDEIIDGMTIDFELNPSSLETPTAPILDGIESWTMPNPSVRSLSALTEGNPYDAVRAYTSKKFRASLGSRKTPDASPFATRATPLGSLIEIDLYWNALDVNLSRTLAGYGIYRRNDTRDQSLALDFVRDPYANFYGDMGGEITPDTSYYYRVSAVNVEFLDRWNDPIDEAESNWSNEMSVTPLGSLRETAPTNGASVTGDPLFSWQPVPRGTAYSVYVYAEFPSIPLDPGGDYGPGGPPSYGVFPIWTSDWENVDSVRYAGPALQANHTYYWIVTAADATETAYSYGELRSFVAR